MRSMPKPIARILRKNSVFAVVGAVCFIASIICFVTAGVKTVKDIRRTITAALEEYEENH